MIKLNHSISNSNPQYYTTVETEVKVTFLAALLGKTPSQILCNVGMVQLVKYPKYSSASLQSMANVCTSILSKRSLHFFHKMALLAQDLVEFCYTLQTGSSGTF